MSRKRFATMVAVVLLLGAMGLLSLYMTLGRMSEALRVQGRPGASGADTGEKIEQMTLTPAGESQLREQQQSAQPAPGAPAPAPAPGAAVPPATPPAGAPAAPSKTPPAAPKPAPASGADDPGAR